MTKKTKTKTKTRRAERYGRVWGEGVGGPADLEEARREELDFVVPPAGLQVRLAATRTEASVRTRHHLRKGGRKRGGVTNW
jgi:hypothetical protein